MSPALNNIQLTDSEITAIKSTVIDGLELAKKELEQLENYNKQGGNLRHRLFDAKERVERALVALETLQDQINAISNH
jgi:hypothetical protein